MIQVHFPLPTAEFKEWASQMLLALTDAFSRIKEPAAGEIVLWADGVTVPKGYLLCDGAEYSKTVSPSLYKILGESSPGNFETPTVTSPSGSVAVIRV